MKSEETVKITDCSEPITLEKITQEPKIDGPVAPYTLAQRVAENVDRCEMCGLPGGKLTIIDVNLKRWLIKTNTNLMWFGKKLEHQNKNICNVGKQTKVLS